MGEGYDDTEDFLVSAATLSFQRYGVGMGGGEAWVGVSFLQVLTHSVHSEGYVRVAWWHSFLF